MESRAPVLIKRHLHVAMQNYSPLKITAFHFRDLPSSHSDAERLNQLLTEQVNWSEGVVIKDTHMHLKGLNEKIHKGLEKLKVQSEFVRSDMYMINLISFHGHGITDDQNDTNFIALTKQDDDRGILSENINVTNLANEFAEIENTINIFFFDCSRTSKSDQPYQI